MQLASQQCETAGQMQLVVDQLPSLACQHRLAAPARPTRAASLTKPNPRDGTCFYFLENRAISSENIPRRGLHPRQLLAGVGPVSVVSWRDILSAIARGSVDMWRAVGPSRAILSVTSDQ